MIRFGVIGTNWITDRFLDGASQLDRFQLHAVYSRTDEKAKEFAGKYNVEHTYTDLEAFAHSDAFDAVYIASPTALHSQHAITCMKGGKHVIVEKPFASNEVEVRAMIETAKQYNVTIMEAMKTPHVPNFNRLQESLEKIGPVRRFVANFCQYSSRYDKYKEGVVLNAFKPELSNGSLMDIGVYCIYPMVALFGKPERVKATAYMLESGVDGEGTVTVDYPSLNGVCMFSKITNSEIPSEIQGENGSIVIGKFSDMKDIKVVYKDGTEEKVDGEQQENSMYYETKSFIESIENNEIENNVNTWENSIETMRILDAARKEIGLVFPADEVSK
ncbi:Gfo/Idh/MocA family oxidoreductase [Gracilibacillus sp. S3-1-1]|uniref:Gfo/Idh/MocA family oxidoreductase n=1 Tax=Gracilibacillus pellucidus TaxID=3095368 RepID=A0ACC6M7K2_9BACI|nr:Gfo/Idh/MocA family oxidoreductase [Gracilibacillus sp. S3-1-1]MDX8046807.1 Gfo/Idh/MocA family oxidoreductase [Gracilibacillus sp. S3-1-1]